MLNVYLTELTDEHTGVALHYSASNKFTLTVMPKCTREPVCRNSKQHFSPYISPPPTKSGLQSGPRLHLHARKGKRPNRPAQHCPRRDPLWPKMKLAKQTPNGLWDSGVMSRHGTSRELSPQTIAKPQKICLARCSASTKCGVIFVQFFSPQINQKD